MTTTAPERESAIAVHRSNMDTFRAEHDIDAYINFAAQTRGHRIPWKPGDPVKAYGWTNIIDLLLRGVTERVCGMRGWNNWGRKVKKGSKGIRLIYWRFIPDKSSPLNEEGEHTRQVPIASWSKPVFRYSDTEEMPDFEGEVWRELELPRPEPVTGDSHARYLDTLITWATDHGYTVEVAPNDEGGGSLNLKTNHIILNSPYVNGQFMTLVHELAHGEGKVDYAKFERADAECIVQAVAFIVCRNVGLDVGIFSGGYCSVWDAVRKDKESDPLVKYLRLIDTLCASLEGALV